MGGAIRNLTAFKTLIYRTDPSCQSFGADGWGGSASGSQSASSGSSDAGPNSGNKGDGHVYTDLDPFTKIQDRVKTTPAEDKWLQEQMKNENGNRGNYNLLLNNCRHYSKDLYERLKDLLEEKRNNEKCKE